MELDQQHLQNLGFFGILKHSTKIILSWPKIFSQITLSLILPISLIFLAHIQASQSLLNKIEHHQDELRNHSDAGNHLHRLITAEWIYFWLLKIAYFTVLLILALLSTAAVVYTIASILTSKPVTFKRVISVVPRVWKRLMVTFFWSFGLVFLYNIVAVGVFFTLALLISGTVIGAVVLIIYGVLYLVGLLYITIIWHVASVVSVLEEVYGLKALVKGKNLIKGKKWSAFGLFLLLGALIVGIQTVYAVFVVYAWELGLALRIGIGAVCVAAMVMVILLGLVIQTVVYLVCKAYHHESIERSALLEHLEAYECEYVNLRKDVQMQQI